MTAKFKNLSQELDKLCVKTNKVKTRKQARTLSLKKWKSIRKMSEIFFGEFNVRCGFCGYGEHKAKEETQAPGGYPGRCGYCGVKTICDQMVEKAQDLHEETETLIDGLIAHFENMKVADN